MEEMPVSERVLMIIQYVPAALAVVLSGMVAVMVVQEERRPVIQQVVAQVQVGMRELAELEVHPGKQLPTDRVVAVAVHLQVAIIQFTVQQDQEAELASMAKAVMG
jgi:flagellar basal body-associated protein FliL